MGSSTYKISGYTVPNAATGPTGSTGDTGDTGPSGFGSTGNTGPSVLGMGICGDKIRTYFDDGSTYDTASNFKGNTGNTILFVGVTNTGDLSIFSGFSQNSNTISFRNIRGNTSASLRANVSFSLDSDENIKISYLNSPSNLDISITGSTAIGTFVGYSGDTFTSIPTTSYGDYSSIIFRNIFEKTRGMGFTSATGADGLGCNYITGGTFFYFNYSGLSASFPCSVLNINPNCVSNSPVDMGMKNTVFYADMSSKVTTVKIDNSNPGTDAYAITLFLKSALNIPPGDVVGTVTAIGQKRFQLSHTGGSLLWPFGIEPCFASQQLYHFYNLGGYTWYGSVVYRQDPNFQNCINVINPLSLVEYGACCITGGFSGPTCANESFADCMARGSGAFWHAGLTCGSNPCQKTGGCCLSFTEINSPNSKLCLNGITCINCISGMVYDSFGATYNAYSFAYLGNGLTCNSANCPVGEENE